MSTDEKDYQPLSRAPDFRIHSPDGFVSTAINRETDATVSLTFWNIDVTPDRENLKLPYEHPEHYSVKGKHILQTAIMLKPDVALQMAMGILEVLSKMPQQIKVRYGLPEGVQKVRIETK